MNQIKLNASQIRTGLEQLLPNNKLLYEFTFRINGTIADVLDITTNNIIGYEIKSDLDSYVRLPKQINGYNSVCQKIYVVVGESKKNSISKHIPNYYGIIVATALPNSKVKFTTIRTAQNNPNKNTKHILYWLPVDKTKKYAKQNNSILQKYNNKKTTISKLPKSTLVRDILTFETKSSIEEIVLNYLRSNEFETKRKENANINIAIRQNKINLENKEYYRRLANYNYLQLDVNLLKNSTKRISTIVRSFNKKYLPLSLENSATGTHQGWFKYDMNSKSLSISIQTKNEIITIDASKELFSILQQALKNKDNLTTIISNVKKSLPENIRPNI